MCHVPISSKRQYICVSTKLVILFVSTTVDSRVYFNRHNWNDTWMGGVVTRTNQGGSLREVRRLVMTETVIKYIYALPPLFD